MDTRVCSTNQISAGCIPVDTECVKECSNITDTGCRTTKNGMYGAIKDCDVLRLPRPAVNEGFFSPDDPAKIAALSAGGFNASRDAGLLNVPMWPGRLSTTGMLLVGGGLVLAIIVILFIILYLRSGSK